MSRRLTFLLWVVLAGLVGVLGLQMYLSRTELRQAEVARAAVQKSRTRAETALAAAAGQATRLAERLELQQKDPAAERRLTPEEQVVEALREKLAALERRHPKAERPPPLTNPFGQSRVAELQNPSRVLAHEAQSRRRRSLARTQWCPVAEPEDET